MGRRKGEEEREREGGERGEREREEEKASRAYILNNTHSAMRSKSLTVSGRLGHVKSQRPVTREESAKVSTAHCSALGS